MYCKYCGKQISDDAKFCVECGRPVDDTKPDIPKPEIQIPQNPSKPLYKRVWFWVLGVPVLLFILFFIYNIFLVLINPGVEAAKEATVVANARAQYAEDAADAMINGTELPPSPSLSPSLSTDKNVEDNADDNIIDCDISGCHVKYLSHEIVVNMAGDTCLAVYFQFDNNSDEPKSFTLTINDKAYQDGIELSFSMFHVNDLSKDAERSIQPGVSLVVCSGFELRNEMSDIEMTVAPLFSWENSPTDSMILSIEDM